MDMDREKLMQWMTTNPPLVVLIDGTTVTTAHPSESLCRWFPL